MLEAEGGGVHLQVKDTKVCQQSPEVGMRQGRILPWSLLGELWVCWMFSGCGWKSLGRKWYMHLSQARPGLEVSPPPLFTAVGVPEVSLTL